MTVITAQIDGLAYGGELVGSVVAGPDELIGKRAFVRGAVPGERVDAELTADHRGHVEARLLRVIESSPQRRQPPCPLFGECGGCDLQQMPIALQREAKRSMVERTLAMQAKIIARHGVSLIGAELAEFNYRRRVTFHLARDGSLGFYRSGTGDVVPCPECLIARPEINELLRRISPISRDLAPLVASVVLEAQPWEGENRGYALFRLREECESVAGVEQQLCLQLERIALPYAAVERRQKIVAVVIAGARQTRAIETPIGHFSQVNEEANQVLVDVVCAEIQGSTVVDLYAGSGNLSIALARRGATVTAVEFDRALIRHGQQLARRAGIDQRLRFVADRCERYVSSHPPVGSLVLDPPRSGAKQVIAALSPTRTPEVVYVSCNLPSLARDLKIMVERGYCVQKIQVLDMFAQTHHVETITSLSSGLDAARG